MLNMHRNCFWSGAVHILPRKPPGELTTFPETP